MIVLKGLYYIGYEEHCQKKPVNLIWLLFMLLWNFYSCPLANRTVAEEEDRSNRNLECTGLGRLWTALQVVIAKVYIAGDPKRSELGWRLPLFIVTGNACVCLIIHSFSFKKFISNIFNGLKTLIFVNESLVNQNVSQLCWRNHNIHKYKVQQEQCYM